MEEQAKGSLVFLQKSGRYAYRWRTREGWEGTCRQLIMKLKDDTVHRAYFGFD